MFVVYTCASASSTSLLKAGATAEQVLDPLEPHHGTRYTTDSLMERSESYGAQHSISPTQHSTDVAESESQL